MSTPVETTPTPSEQQAASTPATPPPAASPAEAGAWWRGRGELVLAGVLFALGATLLYGNATMRVVGEGGMLGPQGFGWLVAALCGAVGLLLCLNAFRKPVEKRAEDAAKAADTNWTALATVFAGLVGFTFLVEPIGWLPMATLLFTTVATGLGNRNVLRSLTIGFILASVIQIVFSGMLGLALPPGLLERG